MSQRFWLSAHWMQMLPSSSSFHLQSIQEKFMAPLCCSELQAKAAVLTWQRPEEQQEQKCCQLPLGEGGQGCAWNGQSRSPSCHQHSSCCGRKEGMERCGCQESIPAAPGTSSSPAAPPMGGQCWVLHWIAQGSALKHPTKASAKRSREKISLQKECICTSIAGVLREGW